MKTIPMIFNTEMVKALLDGRKTVTRRLIKDQSIVWNYSGDVVADAKYNNLNIGDLINAIRDDGDTTPVALLKVTDVDIERVQDITEEEAKAEGVNPVISQWEAPESFVVGFAKIWNSIYSNWNENPYVWVVEFEVIHRNVDGVAL